MSVRAFELQKIKQNYSFYMTRLGLSDRDTRKREYALARGAFVVAYRPYASLMELGDVIDRDHSSVIHNLKTHESRIRYKDYNWAYKIACDVRDANPIESLENPDLQGLTEEIKRLNEQIIELIKYKELYLTLKKTFDEF
jgi:hypothetical protein